MIFQLHWHCLTVISEIFTHDNDKMKYLCSIYALSSSFTPIRLTASNFALGSTIYKYKHLNLCLISMMVGLRLPC